MWRGVVLHALIGCTEPPEPIAFADYPATYEECGDGYTCNAYARCELQLFASRIGEQCVLDSECLSGHCLGVCVDPYVCY
jgi:hypothetical protein